MSRGMEIHVSDEALGAATRCAKGFSCIKGEEKDLCVVEECVDGKVHFIKCKSDGACSYQQSFGFSYLICYCPVRIEIFQKYKI